MKNNKRRLLKDLPFEGLKKGVVLWKGGRGHGGEYSISRGETYYSGGGSSSNGILTFERPVEEIINLVWDNSEWFEDADLKEVEVIASTTSITLRFKSIDKDEAEELAKGIIHIFPHIEETGWVWSKFKDIVLRITNI